MKNFLKEKGLLVFIVSVIAMLTVVAVKSTGPRNAATGTGRGIQSRPVPETKQVWYCPMHPAYHADGPGSCPICHMDLVKLEGDLKNNVMDEKARHPERSARQTNRRVRPSFWRKGSSQSEVLRASGPQDDGGQIKEMTLEEVLQMKPGDLCLLHKCQHGFCNIQVTEEILRRGKCPHCGEDFGILLKEAAPQGYASVKLTPDKEQMIGVRTQPARKQRLMKSLRAVATVARDPELYQAQAEYLQALEAFEKAKSGGIPEIESQAARLLESTRIRLTALGLTLELIQEIEARKEPDRSLLYVQAGQTPPSDFSGIGTAPAGQPVWVYAQVYEYEIPYVKIGQEVEVQPPDPAAPDAAEKGRVMAVDPWVDPVTRTTRVRIRIERPSGTFKPDMFTNVRIVSDLGEVLSIPKDAVMDTGTRKLVFVRSHEGKYEPRSVETGAVTETDAEIRSGLAEGEEVVVSGNFLIDSESRLKAALQSIRSGGAHSHA